jgi:hypothetical protein
MDENAEVLINATGIQYTSVCDNIPSSRQVQRKEANTSKSKEAFTISKFLLLFRDAILT